MTPAAGVTSSAMVCAGCGVAALDPDGSDGSRFPFRCARAADDRETEHVLTQALDASAVTFPTDYEPNPFVRYRSVSHAWHFARAHGMPDTRFTDIVRTLDSAIGRLDGFGFVTTPFAAHARLTQRLGQRAVWIKDETVNVSGTHKARHLMGIMIYLQVAEAVGFRGLSGAKLAIASCGNAALAAALVARAASRPIDVFIPPDAPSAVVARLKALAASMVVCERNGSEPGDPCYLRFRAAVRAGAVPFCCQGPANALTIQGGKTLGYEMIAALGGVELDAIVVQVGGGALASSLVQAFDDALALRAIARRPRFYAVQTRGAYPLKRAYDHLASLLARAPTADATERQLHYALTHRSEFMWPWEATPRSLARGILDDETYDWFAIVKGMLASGGAPVVVDEDTLEEAHVIGRMGTGVKLDHTGAAGLAGLLQLTRDGAIRDHETVAVIFSGAER